MLERFDELRYEAYRVADGLPWDHPQQIRQRGKRRARHRFVVISLTAALVATGSVSAAAAFFDRDQPTPTPPPATSAPPEVTTPSPSGSPDPTPSRGTSVPEPSVEIPDTALLQPEDVGDEYRATLGRGLEDSKLEWLLHAVCDAGDWSDTGNIVGSNSRILSSDAAGENSIRQVATRYTSSQRGADYLSDIIANTDRCRDIRGHDGQRIQLRLVDHDFAGEASILVRVDRGGEWTYHVFVRQAGVVTEIWVDQASEDYARTLGRKAATRLCEATPTC